MVKPFFKISSGIYIRKITKIILETAFVLFYQINEERFFFKKIILSQTFFKNHLVCPP